MKWVPLLVPEEDYVELANLVLERVIERNEVEALEVIQPVYAPQASQAGVVADDALASLMPWSVEDLTRLAHSDAVTAQRWARAMDVCAERVGEYISTQDVAKAAGMTVNEWRDAPRKISRHIASQYPAAPGWPLAVRSGRSLGHVYDQAYWAITEEQARRWREARKGGRR